MLLFSKLIIILVQNSLLIYQKVICIKILWFRFNAEIIISLSIANQRYLNRKSLPRYPKKE